MEPESGGLKPNPIDDATDSIQRDIGSIEPEA
jgi:hypothetical protein